MGTTTLSNLTIQDIWPSGTNTGDNKPKKTIDSAALLPYIIVPVLILMGTTNRELSIIIVVFIGMGALYVNSRPRQKNRSPFFFSWTIASCVTMLLVFEISILGEMEITQLEHLVLIVLLCCMAYFFYKMKAVADFVLAKGSSKEKEYSPVLTADSKYCQICQIEVNDRFFHSIWWDCCVLRSNYCHFLAGQIFAFAILLFGTYLGFNTACQPYGTYGDKQLVPFDYCHEAHYEFWTALDFATCVYGVGYLIVVALVLIRQLLIYIPKYSVKYLFGGQSAKQPYQPVSQQDV